MTFVAGGGIQFTSIIVPIVVAVIALVPSVWAGISSKRMRRELEANRNTEQARNAIEQVYGQAYDRASRINTEVVSGLRDEIQRLRKELDDVRAHALASERRNTNLERKYAAMSRALDRMQALVNNYTTQLRDLGVDVPHEDVNADE